MPPGIKKCYSDRRDSSFRGNSLFARVEGRSPKNMTILAVKNEASRGRFGRDPTHRDSPFIPGHYDLFLSRDIVTIVHEKYVVTGEEILDG